MKGARICSVVASVKDQLAGVFSVAHSNRVVEVALPFLFPVPGDVAVFVITLPGRAFVAALLDVARRVTRR